MITFNEGKGKGTMGIQTDNITFFRRGDSFMLGTDAPAQRYKKLPAATYLLRVSMEAGYYLELADDFELPSKLYGNLETKADKILNTYKTRRGTTGVLLCGEKGSGKTLLTKLISTKAREQGMPTILVNFAAQGDGFNTFLSSVEQSCVVLFDEFEKTYDKEEQAGLLTLLDGVFSSHKLCLLTSNDFTAIDSHMKNRPGRIYYYLNFEGLDTQFVTEYGQDNLRNKSHVKGLQVLSSFVKPMNFDMLKAVVEEANRYDQSPLETLDMLNVKVSGYVDTFLYELSVPGKEIIPPKPDSEDEDDGSIRCNPLNGVNINYYYKSIKPASKKGGKAQKSVECTEIGFSATELVSLDALKGIYEYEKEDGSKLKLKLKPIAAYGMAKVKHLIGDPSVDPNSDL